MSDITENATKRVDGTITENQTKRIDGTVTEVLTKRVDGAIAVNETQRVPQVGGIQKVWHDSWGFSWGKIFVKNSWDLSWSQSSFQNVGSIEIRRVPSGATVSATKRVG